MKALRRTSTLAGGLGPERQLCSHTLLSAFFRDRSPHTLRAYTLDLEDFSGFMSRRVGTRTAPADAVRLFLSAGGGLANELALHYRADLTSRGFAPSTVGRRLATLRSMARFGRLIGMIGWSIEVGHPSKELTKDTRGPSAADAARLLTYVSAQPAPQGLRDVAMLRLMLDLGLRVSEVVGLDVDDIEGAPAPAVWIKGKGRRSKERLSMPQASASALAAWLSWRERPAIGPVFIRERDVRHGSRDGRLVTRSVYKLVRDYGRAIGLRLHPHKLRHTAITLAVEHARRNDIGIEEVRQFSRHRQIQTLLIYRDQHRNVQGQLAELVSAGIPAEAVAKP